MQFHRGRLFDHVHLVVRDLAASRRFYEAVLGALGIPLGGGDARHFWADELFVSAGEPRTGRVHLAFQADGAEAVHRFHVAALASGGQAGGGQAEGAPGERPYHPGYYAAYAMDPDGNNIEAVYHGPARRSADSIVITAGG